MERLTPLTRAILFSLALANNATSAASEDFPVLSAETNKLILKNILENRRMQLSNDVFSSFDYICLIGWDRSGAKPKQMRGICKDAMDHSIAGVNYSSNKCIVLAMPRAVPDTRLNVLGSSDSECRMPGNQISLEIVERPAGFFDVIRFKRN